MWRIKNSGAMGYPRVEVCECWSCGVVKYRGVRSLEQRGNPVIRSSNVVGVAKCRRVRILELFLVKSKGVVLELRGSRSSGVLML